jgi:MOSC domain-containing protein YiiM
VADAENHGGPDQALLGYAAEHYAAWSAELGGLVLPYGAFGENLAISRLDERSVCIGDIYRIGEARVQVALPRSPCWKLARRLRIPRITEYVHDKARGGWYMRVLTEGRIEQGQPVVLEDRPHPEWSVARAYRVYHDRVRDPAAALDLAQCASLARHWKARLRAEG